jgi:glycosyltransferase involved in cell wall biosynthesis
MGCSFKEILSGAFMRILFTINPRKRTGPEVWREELTSQLRKRHFIHTSKFSQILKLPYEIYKADVVHTYDPFPHTVIALSLAKLFHKRSVHTVHGDYFAEKNSKRGLKRIFWTLFNSICVKLATVITVPSHYLHKRLLTHDPIFKGAIVIHNGISSFSHKKTFLKHPAFVYITSFNLTEKMRGVDLLIDSFQNAHLLNAQLYVLGNGKYLENYKEKYESSQIQFLGYRENALTYINSSDFFVHFSFLDNYPTVILEALHARKPILATNIGGIPEMLPKKNIVTRADAVTKLKRMFSSPSQFIPPLPKDSYAEVMCERFERVYLGV